MQLIVDEFSECWIWHVNRLIFFGKVNIQINLSMANFIID